MIRKLPLLLISLAILSGNLGLITSPSAYTTICRVQGDKFVSPRLGEYVTVIGIVYADLDETSRKGFFIQQENCDANPSTSDGIFIYTGQVLDLVNSGDLVQVSGWVNEFYEMTELSVMPEKVWVVSRSNPLPAPVELAPPFDNLTSMANFESLEGMYVSLSEGVVVGPTDSHDRSWLVRADLGLSRVFADDALGTGEIICVDDEGLYEIQPEAKVGERVSGLAGALDYSYETYCLQVITEPQVSVVAEEPEVPLFFSTQDSLNWNFATFNLANLFDTLDDPLTDDLVLSSAQYSRKLAKLAAAIHDQMGEPAIIALQEAENATVVGDLVARPEIHSLYSTILEDGPDKRGLDVGLLFRSDLVLVKSWQVRQKCTTLVDGLGPDGNLDVTHPQNNITCDSNGDGILDGNRLFSRPPLLVYACLCVPDCDVRAVHVILLVNHWKSKAEDSQSVPYTLPRRILQAENLSQIMTQLRVENPGVPVILLGDLNDTPGSEPLSILTAAGMEDLTVMLPGASRYTYIYRGISQDLDHILFSGSITILPTEAGVAHINADFPYNLSSNATTPKRSSDHDALVVRFTLFDHRQYLPFVSK